MKLSGLGKGGVHRNGLSETQLAWVLLFPALLIIFSLAFFPVLRTFYLSLFDLRLNHPTKNVTQLDYGYNIERVGDANYRFNRIINAAIDAETNTDTKQDLEQVKLDYEVYFTDFLQATSSGDEYDIVYDLQSNMDTVPLEYSFYTIDNNLAGAFQAELLRLQGILEPYIETATDGQSVKLASQVFDDINYSIISPNFIGLDNYISYFQDSRMWEALARTVVFGVFAVMFEFLIGLSIALLMNRAFKGRGIVRAAVLVPWAIPASVSALIWRFMYDGQYGVLSGFFEQLGIIESRGQILTDGVTTMAGLILADVWKTSPYVSLLLLAGLQSIDASYYEAARVDGANRIQQFFRITLPLLKPSILVAVMFRTMDALRVFDLVSVMTGGGPANGTEVITLYTYKEMFGNMMFGAGSALSVIIFVCLAAFCIFYIKVFGVELIKVDK